MRTSPKRQNETRILNSVLNYAKKLDFIACVWRQRNSSANVGGKYIAFTGLKGVSDLIGILEDGRFLAIEVKTADGKVSSEQSEFITLINSCGGLGLVVRSLDDFINQLIFLGYVNENERDSKRAVLATTKQKRRSRTRTAGDLRQMRK